MNGASAPLPEDPRWTGKAPAWSPDGTHIAFGVFGSDIVVVRRDCDKASLFRVLEQSADSSGQSGSFPSSTPEAPHLRRLEGRRPWAAAPRDFPRRWSPRAVSLRAQADFPYGVMPDLSVVTGRPQALAELGPLHRSITAHEPRAQGWSVLVHLRNRLKIISP